MAKNEDRLELKVVSPKGVAIYPKLNTPSTNFDADGVYEVKLKFDPEDAVAVLDKKQISWADLKEAIDEQQAEHLRAKKAELSKPLPSSRSNGASSLTSTTRATKRA